MNAERASSKSHKSDNEAISIDWHLDDSAFTETVSFKTADGKTIPVSTKTQPIHRKPPQPMVRVLGKNPNLPAASLPPKKASILKGSSLTNPASPPKLPRTPIAIHPQRSAPLPPPITTRTPAPTASTGGRPSKPSKKSRAKSSGLASPSSGVTSDEMSSDFSTESDTRASHHRKMHNDVHASGQISVSPGTDGMTPVTPTPHQRTKIATKSNPIQLAKPLQSNTSTVNNPQQDNKQASKTFDIDHGNADDSKLQQMGKTSSPTSQNIPNVKSQAALGDTKSQQENNSVMTTNVALAAPGQPTNVNPKADSANTRDSTTKKTVSDSTTNLPNEGKLNTTQSQNSVTKEANNQNLNPAFVNDDASKQTNASTEFQKNDKQKNSNTTQFATDALASSNASEKSLSGKKAVGPDITTPTSNVGQTKSLEKSLEGKTKNEANAGAATNNSAQPSNVSVGISKSQATLSDGKPTATKPEQVLGNTNTSQAIKNPASDNQSEKEAFVKTEKSEVITTVHGKNPEEPNSKQSLAADSKTINENSKQKKDVQESSVQENKNKPASTAAKTKPSVDQQNIETSTISNKLSKTEHQAKQSSQSLSDASQLPSVTAQKTTSGAANVSDNVSAPTSSAKPQPNENNPQNTQTQAQPSVVASSPPGNAGMHENIATDVPGPNIQQPNAVPPIASPLSDILSSELTSASSTTDELGSPSSEMSSGLTSPDSDKIPKKTSKKAPMPQPRSGSKPDEITSTMQSQNSVQVLSVTDTSTLTTKTGQTKTTDETSTTPSDSTRKTSSDTLTNYHRVNVFAASIQGHQATQLFAPQTCTNHQVFTTQNKSNLNVKNDDDQNKNIRSNTTTLQQITGSVQDVSCVSSPTTSATISYNSTFKPEISHCTKQKPQPQSQSDFVHSFSTSTDKCKKNLAMNIEQKRRPQCSGKIGTCADKKPQEISDTISDNMQSSEQIHTYTSPSSKKYDRQRSKKMEESKKRDNPPTSSRGEVATVDEQH